MGRETFVPGHGDPVDEVTDFVPCLVVDAHVGTATFPVDDGKVLSLAHASCCEKVV